MAEGGPPLHWGDRPPALGAKSSSAAKLPTSRDKQKPSRKYERLRAPPCMGFSRSCSDTALGNSLRTLSKTPYPVAPPQPMSIELATYEAVKAGFWRWLEGDKPCFLKRCSCFAR